MTVHITVYNDHTNIQISTGQERCRASKRLELYVVIDAVNTLIFALVSVQTFIPNILHNVAFIFSNYITCYSLCRKNKTMIQSPFYFNVPKLFLE